MDSLRFDRSLRSQAEQHLGRHPRRALDHAAGRRAAVAVTLVPDDAGDAAVILTVRAAGLRRHGGQWALPGGRMDPGETAEEAARRELVEEVGIDLAAESVLGLLDDFPTRSGFIITPVVVWGCPDGSATAVELQPDPNEVAEVHLAPLFEIGRPENLLVDGTANPERPLLALAILGTTIFAPTAAMLYQFSEVAVQGRSTRVAHYEQPRFAWH